jgi:hypothetical protein
MSDYLLVLRESYADALLMCAKYPGKSHRPFSQHQHNALKRAKQRQRASFITVRVLDLRKVLDHINTLDVKRVDL